MDRLEAVVRANSELPAAQILSLSSKGEMAILLRKHPADGEPAGTLARASVSGGPPREASEEVEGADFSADGASMLLVRRSGGIPIASAKRASNSGLVCPDSPLSS